MARTLFSSRVATSRAMETLMPRFEHLVERLGKQAAMHVRVQCVSRMWWQVTSAACF